MARDVFISHSAKNKTIANAVCTMLESEGVTCWIAPRDVTPGMEWGECIIEAIEQARVMVLIFTAEANSSPQIRREIERAANRGVVILPLRIEDVAPGKALEYFIGNVHWLDALTPPLEPHLRNLADTIETLIARMAPRDGEPPRPVPSTPRATPVRADRIASGTAAPAPTVAAKHAARPAWLLPAAGGAAVLILALAAWLYFGKRGATQTPAAPASAAGPSEVSGAILESEDGEHWTTHNTATPDILEATFASSDGTRLWAIGKNGAILESENGAKWAEGSTGTPNNLYSIFGTSDGRRLWAVGNLGTIVESDDGMHWNRLDSGTPYTLLSVYGTSDGKRLWAVGDGGTVVESDDGQNWTAYSSGTPNILQSIFVTGDGRRVWVVGRNATILESSDGTHWNSLNSGTTINIFSIFGTSDGKHLWAAGH
jgi:TIR domain